MTGHVPEYSLCLPNIVVALVIATLVVQAIVVADGAVSLSVRDVKGNMCRRRCRRRNRSTRDCRSRDTHRRLVAHGKLRERANAALVGICTTYVRSENRSRVQTLDYSIM